MIGAGSWVALAVALAASLAYLIRLFVFRTPYTTRGHDVGVVLGVALAAVAFLAGDASWRVWAAGTVAFVWFALTRIELRLGRSPMAVAVGDPLPSFVGHTTGGTTLGDRELVARAPALVFFFRGKW